MCASTVRSENTEGDLTTCFAEAMKQQETFEREKFDYQKTLDSAKLKMDTANSNSSLKQTCLQEWIRKGMSAAEIKFEMSVLFGDD
jgi:hypothetical protein